jgi:hypothetical protein
VNVKRPFVVIPGRAEGANPESRGKHCGFWIPDRRFAASGMTAGNVAMTEIRVERTR